MADFRKGARNMDDKKIVDLFIKRDESALTETEQKYGRYCHYVANNILGSDEDSEECVNDTYLRTWHAIPPSIPDNLKAFIGKITRNLALDMYDKNHAQKRNDAVELVFDELAEVLSDKPNDLHLVEELSLKNALNAFLGELNAKKRTIFLQRYWYMSSIKDIAARFGMSENSVKVTLKRLREKFKDRLEKEGFKL